MLEAARDIVHRQTGLRPGDDGFRIELHVLDAAEFAQSEPVRRGPMAGIAEGDQRLAVIEAVLGHEPAHGLLLDHGRAGAEPVRMREQTRLRQRPRTRRRAMRRLAVIESLRTRIDQRGAVFAIDDGADVVARGDPGFTQADGDLARLRCGAVRRERELLGRPGLDAAIEDGEIVDSCGFSRSSRHAQRRRNR